MKTNHTPKGQEANKANKARLSSYDLADVKPLPDVLELLPSLLQHALAFFDLKHEKDVLLTATLPVLGGCMPNVQGQYGKKKYTTHLYSAVVARAGGGKGAAEFARKLARKIKVELNYDPMSDDAIPGDPTPFVPANSSAAAIYHAINLRNGTCIIFETEIDTLAIALGQEWGQFGDVLRKAYHHEDISLLRNEKEIHIADPQISLFLSGTEGQFMRLIPSSENGLYSRIALYYFSGASKWISQRPSKQNLEIEGAFEGFSKEVLKMYTALAERSEPLMIGFAENHWDMIDNTFEPLMKRLSIDGFGHVDSIIKRAGLNTFRIAMIFCVLRLFEKGEDLTGLTEATVSENDLQAALALAVTYADHALRFSRKLDKNAALGRSSEIVRKLFDMLPDSFSKNDAENIGSNKLGIKHRTIRNYLKQYLDGGVIKRVQHGQYEKTC